MTTAGLVAGSFGGLVTGGLVILIIGVGSTLVSGRNDAGVDGIGLIMVVVGGGGLLAWRRWALRRSSVGGRGKS